MVFLLIGVRSAFPRLGLPAMAGKQKKAAPEEIQCRLFAVKFLVDRGCSPYIVKVLLFRKPL